MASIILDGSFVRVPISPPLKTKVQITKGNKTDTYILSKNTERNVFPLQYGDGSYTVKIYQSAGRNHYTLIHNQIVTTLNATECWLEPSFYVWYDDAVKTLSDKINADNPKQRLSAYFKYCYNSIKDDPIKSFFYKRCSSYLPDIEKTIRKGKGSGIDRAAVLCALCRINGIECKLVVGSVAARPHAWCQVKVNGYWRTLDPTYLKQYKIEDYKTEHTY